MRFGVHKDHNLRDTAVFWRQDRLMRRQGLSTPTQGAHGPACPHGLRTRARTVWKWMYKMPLFKVKTHCNACLAGASAHPLQGGTPCTPSSRPTRTPIPHLHPQPPVWLHHAPPNPVVRADLLPVRLLRPPSPSPCPCRSLSRPLPLPLPLSLCHHAPLLLLPALLLL